MTQNPSEQNQPVDPTLRCSDADREHVVAELNRHFTEGRLTLEEFDERSSTAYHARTYADLAPLTADLPHGPIVPAEQKAVPVPPSQPPVDPARWQKATRALGSWLSVSLMLTVIWAIGGRGNFWPGWVIGIWGFFVLMNVARTALDSGGHHLDNRAQRRATRDRRRNGRELDK
jgi:DUF1707 SHOCT-like domain